MRPPVGIPVGAPFLVACGVVLAGIAALLVVLLRRRRKPATVVEVEAPPVPPDVEARSALDRLAGSRLLSEERFKEFYVALAELAKRYLERRLDAAVLEMTSSETIAFLRDHPPRAVPSRSGGFFTAGHLHTAGRGSQDTTHDRDQRRFAAARRPLEQGHLALVDIQVDTVKRARCCRALRISFDVWVETCEGGEWRCAECKEVSAVYDHSEEQSWRHLDTCQCRTYVHARLPRTTCRKHGVRQVMAPWAGPRSGFTLLMECRVIDTLKECDVTGCCRLTGVSWDQGWTIVERAVKRGQTRKKWRIPEYMSIDEKSFAKRHNYETLVCDLKGGTVEYVVDDRTQESLETYFRQFSECRAAFA